MDPRSSESETPTSCSVGRLAPRRDAWVRGASVRVLGIDSRHSPPPAIALPVGIQRDHKRPVMPRPTDMLSSESAVMTRPARAGSRALPPPVWIGHGLTEQGGE